MQKAVEIRKYVEESQAKGNCSLCAQDVENLMLWPIDTNVFTGNNELSDEGHQEMFGLGSRLKEMFPNILHDLSNSDYTFRPTSDKIQDSAKAFVAGIGSKGLKIEKVMLDDAIAVSFLY